MVHRTLLLSSVPQFCLCARGGLVGVPLAVTFEFSGRTSNCTHCFVAFRPSGGASTEQWLYSRRKSHRQRVNWVLRTRQDVIHRRLSARYRSETCVLAIKRQEVLAMAGMGADVQGMRWLQASCKSYLAGSLDTGSLKGMTPSKDK